MKYVLIIMWTMAPYATSVDFDSVATCEIAKQKITDDVGKTWRPVPTMWCVSK